MNRKSKTETGKGALITDPIQRAHAAEEQKLAEELDKLSAQSGANVLERPLTWIIITAVVLALAICIVLARRIFSDIEPASSIPGYYAMSQTVMSGGTDGAALVDITTYIDGDDTVLCLAFSGETPSYRVQAHTSPARVSIELMHLESWPAALNLDTGGNQLLVGMFRDATAPEGVTRLTFQTRRNIGYRVENTGTELRLRIQAVDEVAPAGYYVQLDEYEAMINGVFESSALSPVLCADGANVTLLSQRYETGVEAESAAQAFNQNLFDVLPRINAKAVQLGGNEAPVAHTASDTAAPRGKQVYSANSDARLWVDCAEFLCWMPDYTRAAFQKKTSIGGLDYYEIWLYDRAGKGQRLLDVEFNHIIEARFSGDGKALCFNEQTEAGAVLYYYSINDRVLRSSRDIAGERTYSFEFADDGSVYIVGGVDYAQLLVWHPQADADMSLTVLLEETDLTGSLCAGSADWSPDELFLSDGEGSIYSFKLDTLQTSYLTEGAYVRRSPGGRFLLLLGGAYLGDADEFTALSLYNVSTRSAVSVASDVSLCSECWSTDGGSVYYLAETESDDSAYDAALYRYDIATDTTTALGNIASYTLYTGATANELICEVAYTDADGVDTVAVYSIDVG